MQKVLLNYLNSALLIDHIKSQDVYRELCFQK